MAEVIHSKSHESIKYLKLMEITEVMKRIQSLSRICAKPKTEYLRVDRALGRVSAEEIRSLNDVPARSISAMDGYAIRAIDSREASSTNPVYFRIKGAVYPSSSFSSRARKNNGEQIPKLKAGETYEIATGAPLPMSADSVVRVEEARRENDRILIRRQSPMWKNISIQGEDIKRGGLLFSKRRILSAPDIALLLGVGVRKIKTFQAPKIGILSIGNELIEFDGEIAAGSNRRLLGKIVNNYAHLISGFIENLGARAVPLGIAKDDFTEIRNMIAKGLRACDMVITIAGSSVGKMDHATDAISSLSGSRILFHGVRLVPIRPAGLALVGRHRKPVAIIPGHAVSAALTFFVIALPVINILNGLPYNSRESILNAEVDRTLTNDRAIDALYLVRLKKQSDFISSGNYIASPLGWGSNILSNLSESNGFFRLSPHETVNKSDIVQISLFGAGEMGRIYPSSATLSEASASPSHHESHF